MKVLKKFKRKSSSLSSQSIPCQNPTLSRSVIIDNVVYVNNYNQGQDKELFLCFRGSNCSQNNNEKTVEYEYEAHLDVIVIDSPSDQTNNVPDHRCNKIITTTPCKSQASLDQPDVESHSHRSTQKKKKKKKRKDHGHDIKNSPVHPTKKFRHPPKPHECPVCQDTFRTIKLLAKHFSKEHNSII